MAFVKFVATNMQYFAGAGISLLLCTSEYPNTLGLDKYRRVIAHYKDGKEQPMDPPVADMAEKVSFAYEMIPNEQAGLQFFTCYGHNPCHKGSIKLRTGALIGLPATFSYTSLAQVQTQDLVINNEPVDWECEAGRHLINSLVLSEKAKEFAIAREIAYVNTNMIYSETFLRGAFFALAYTAGRAANEMLQLRTRMKRWGRIGMYGIIGCVFFFLYTTVADTYFCYRDNKVDKKASKLGKEYAEGGVEFYNKVLERNKALRSLMGREGQEIYTLYGNEQVSSFRRPHVQLTERRDNLMKYLNEYNLKKSKDEDSANPQKEKL